MALNLKQQRFVAEYLIDKNATQAAIRAGYSAKTARSQGQRLLTNADIAAAVALKAEKQIEKLDITAEKVLERWWNIATADPNELIQFRRTCCRYCHGVDHRYQWRDKEEFAAALAVFHAKTADNDGRKPLVVQTEAPSDEGGYGFHRLADPHPECPQCCGEGRAELFPTDTRKLSPQARMLFAGVKETQAGIEIKFQDQGKALELIARHLGMLNDKLRLSNPDAVIAEMIRQGMSPREAADRYRDELG